MSGSVPKSGRCEACNNADIPVMACSTRGQKGTRKLCHPCVRENNRWNLYGVTPEVFEQMRREQNYACALCKKPETECKRPGPGGHYGLVIDHHHESGKVRALLCIRCNGIVGWCDENPIVLANIIAYLSEHA